MKRYLAMMLVSLLGLFGFTTQANVMETEGGSSLPSSVSDFDTIKDLDVFFDKYDVNNEDRELLIEKLERGELWDSLTGKQPIEVRTELIQGDYVRIEKFEDGSISATGIESRKTGAGATLFTVDSCKRGSGNHYEVHHIGCRAYVDRGVLMMSFRFDRVTNPGALGRITRYYAYSTRGVLASFNNVRFDRFSPQVVRLSADIHIIFKGSPIQITGWIEAHLGYGTAAWTEDYL